MVLGRTDNIIFLLQADNIIFTGHIQICSKYPKKQACNIFAVSQKRREA